MIWAMTDPLTGLYNRRFALPRLTEIIHAAQRDGTSCGLLALDVDKFKRINDLHGHAAGDRVLAEIAAHLQAAIGTSGFAARMGGEEFIAILPRTDAAAAARTAETIRCAIMSAPIALPRGGSQRSLSATVSIGVALCPARLGADPAQIAESLLEEADRAMRAAKAQGRNQCVLARALRAA